MKNLKFYLLASSAILITATIAHGSDEDSGYLSDCSGRSTPVYLSDCSGRSIPVYAAKEDADLSEDAGFSVEERMKHHYEAQLSISEKRKLENELEKLRLKRIKEDVHACFVREEAELLSALEKLRASHEECMGDLEQGIKDAKHETEMTLDISAYSQYIVTVLTGIEAFRQDPKADIDESTLFVAMKQLSESNLRKLMHIQTLCDGMDQLKYNALRTLVIAKSCGLYAHVHVHQAVAKINILVLAHDINETRKLLDTLNADLNEKAFKRKHQILASDKMKNLQAQIWKKANLDKPAQDISSDVARILDGTFIPFVNYPIMPPELSALDITRLVANHPEAAGITILIAQVITELKTSHLTTEETAHLSNLEREIAQGMSDLDSARKETKMYKLMEALSAAVKNAENHQDDKLAATKATIGTLLYDMKSREEFKVLGMFVQDEKASRAIIEQAEALVA